MTYDVIVVGGGMAGLTAAAYSARAGHSTLLLERQDYVGGLVNSFPYKDVLFDGGIRAIENSGIVKPMLRQLGIELDFIPSTVSLGVGEDVVDIRTKDDVLRYKELLRKQFPEDVKEIEIIVDDMFRTMDYMDILYGIDNPLFLDWKENRSYLIKTILPWAFKYLFTVGTIKRYNAPVDEFLRTRTNNQALIDVIGQHFFQKTPAFFALSYFSLYLDYNYPRGGTGQLPNALKEYLLEQGGTIQLKTTITGIDPVARTVTDEDGNVHSYRELIWAADNRFLYQHLALDGLSPKIRKRIEKRRDVISDKRGGDSIYTVYATATLPTKYFQSRHAGHFFYTPTTVGLADVMARREAVLASTDKAEILAWLNDYYDFNTYEVSIPAMRDASLAPEGKTALIISTLFDYDVARHIRDLGWYDEFKAMSQKRILSILEQAIYPDLSDHLVDVFSSTPLTLEDRTNNTDGAITGWAFTNPTMPAEHRMPKIASSVKTPIPHVHQAGMWTFSPAGMPISILTGKLAADKANKAL
jgi:phytoene dehydrogenase-like protein